MKLDLDAIQAAPWGAWQPATTKEDAIHRAKRKWPELKQVSGRGSNVDIWFDLDFEQKVRAIEVRFSRGAWQFRIKPRITKQA
jgi:hypothetical protein